MKTAIEKILVPTDFSASSDNALQYATQLALQLRAKMVLLHVYNVPVNITDVSVIMPTLTELEAGCMQSMVRIKAELLDKFGSELEIDVECKAGFVKEEINLYAEEHDVDLIIVGAQGGGFLDEKLFGSTTSLLMRQATRPVLAIDKEVKFKKIQRVTLACDYGRIQHQHKVLTPLRNLVRAFEAKIFILNVVHDLRTAPTLDEAVAGISLDHALGKVEHTFHQYQHDDVVMGINAFSQEYNSDMVVMIPHKHSFFESLFHESRTKRMAFHAQFPVLTLHE